MADSAKPIILFTNDDGIRSPGLWAAVSAFRDHGRLLVVAPREQQSGMGRSMPHYSEGRIFPYEAPIDCAMIAKPTPWMAHQRKRCSMPCLN